MTDTPVTDEPDGIELDADITEQVNSAYEAGRPLLMAYVNPQGEAHMSFRGSAHVHSSDQLAVWIRDPEGGLLNALPTNPKLTFMFRNPETHAQFTFYGRGRVETDPVIRDRIFDESPEREQRRDPEKKGEGIIVELDSVSGGAPGKRVRMRRA